VAVEALLELSEERLPDDSRLSFSEDLEDLVAALVIIVGNNHFCAPVGHVKDGLQKSDPDYSGLTATYI